MSVLNDPAVIAVITGLASLLTASATLIYVMYSLGMLKQLRKQTGQLHRSTSYDAVKRVIDMLEVHRLERHEVYGLPPEHHKWSNEQKEAAEKVMRVFDIYGHLDRKWFVSRDLLLDLYNHPAVEVWNKVDKYVEEERNRRNQPGHMYELQQLAVRASKAVQTRTKN